MEEYLKDEVVRTRKTDYPIHPLLQGRCSPRAMSGEEITSDELMALFEAARWSPSSYNAQPWRFLYVKRNTPEWSKLYDTLVEFNQKWTAAASALILAVSRDTFEHNNKPAQTHSFDTGSAWMAIALEASHRNLIAHGMQGFDYEKAKINMQIPAGYTVEAMIAIGKPAPKKALSEDLLKSETPSKRRPLAEIAREGVFSFNT